MRTRIAFGIFCLIWWSANTYAAPATPLPIACPNEALLRERLDAVYQLEEDEWGKKIEELDHEAERCGLETATAAQIAYEVESERSKVDIQRLTRALLLLRKHSSQRGNYLDLLAENLTHVEEGQLRNWLDDDLIFYMVGGNADGSLNREPNNLSIFAKFACKDEGLYQNLALPFSNTHKNYKELVRFFAEAMTCVRTKADLKLRDKLLERFSERLSREDMDVTWISGIEQLFAMAEDIDDPQIYRKLVNSSLYERNTNGLDAVLLQRLTLDKVVLLLEMGDRPAAEAVYSTGCQMNKRPSGEACKVAKSYLDLKNDPDVSLAIIFTAFSNVAEKQSFKENEALDPLRRDYLREAIRVGKTARFSRIILTGSSPPGLSLVIRCERDIQDNLNISNLDAYFSNLGKLLSRRDRHDLQNCIQKSLIQASLSDHDLVDRNKLLDFTKTWFGLMPSKPDKDDQAFAENIVRGLLISLKKVGFSFDLETNQLVAKQALQWLYASADLETINRQPSLSQLRLRALVNSGGKPEAEDFTGLSEADFKRIILEEEPFKTVPTGTEESAHTEGENRGAVVFMAAAEGLREWMHVIPEGLLLGTREEQVYSRYSDRLMTRQAKGWQHFSDLSTQVHVAASHWLSVQKDEADHSLVTQFPRVKSCMTAFAQNVEGLYSPLSTDETGALINVLPPAGFWPKVAIKYRGAVAAQPGRPIFQAIDDLDFAAYLWSQVRNDQKAWKAIELRDRLLKRAIRVRGPQSCENADLSGAGVKPPYVIDVMRGALAAGVIETETDERKLSLLVEASDARNIPYAHLIGNEQLWMSDQERLLMSDFAALAYKVTTAARNLDIDVQRAEMLKLLAFRQKVIAFNSDGPLKPIIWQRELALPQLKKNSAIISAHPTVYRNVNMTFLAVFTDGKVSFSIRPDLKKVLWYRNVNNGIWGPNTELNDYQFSELDSHAQYLQIFNPMKRILQSKKRIYAMSSSYPIHDLVSVAATKSASARWLIDDTEIAYVRTTGAIGKISKSLPSAKFVAKPNVFGSPDYGPKPRPKQKFEWAWEGLDTCGLRQLPRIVGGKYPGMNLLVGNDASKINYMSMAQQGRLVNSEILLFYAHGVRLFAENRYQPTVALALSPAPGCISGPGFGRDDNGLLTASDVVLAGPVSPFVILAACHSGDVSDSGPGALVEAFASQGARAIIAADSEVDQASTMYLTESLLVRTSENDDEYVSRSVNAIRKVKKKWGDPAHWRAWRIYIR